MLGDGHSLREIAAALGLSRNTVRRFARASNPGELLVNDAPVGGPASWPGRGLGTGRLRRDH